MEVVEACNNVSQQIDTALSNLATTYEEGKRKIEEATEILLSIKLDLEQSKLLILLSFVLANRAFICATIYCFILFLGQEVNAKESQLGVSRVKESLSQLSKQHKKMKKSLSNIGKKIEAVY